MKLQLSVSARTRPTAQGKHKMLEGWLELARQSAAKHSQNQCSAVDVTRHFTSYLLFDAVASLAAAQL